MTPTTRNITRSDLEQLLVELSPLPELMSQLSEEVTALRRDRQADREAIVRMQETVANLQRLLEKLNGSLATAARCADDAMRETRIQTTRIDSLYKIIWAIIIPVVLMIVDTAIQAFAK